MTKKEIQEIQNAKKQVLKPCGLKDKERNKIEQLFLNGLTPKEIAHQTHHKFTTVVKVLHIRGHAVGIRLATYIPTDEEKQKIISTYNETHSFKDAAHSVRKDKEVVKNLLKEWGIV